MSQQCAVAALKAKADLGIVNGRAKDVISLLCLMHPDHIQHMIWYDIHTVFALGD